MTYRSRVGRKGQVVVAKELRVRHGIRAGGLVEQVSTERGVLLIPVSADDLLGELDAVAEEVGEAWPRGFSAVEAIREDREGSWRQR